MRKLMPPPPGGGIAVSVPERVVAEIAARCTVAGVKVIAAAAMCLWALLLPGSLAAAAAPPNGDLVQPVNEMREARGLVPVAVEASLNDAACAWADQVAGGAEGTSPTLVSDITAAVGERWVRGQQVVASAGSEAEVWQLFKTDRDYLGAASDGGVNLAGVCFSGTGPVHGVLILVADRVGVGAAAGELPTEPLQSVQFTLTLIGAGAAVAISLTALLVSWRR